MKVAVIDSGVNKEIFPKLNLRQVRFYDGQAIEEEPKDFVGHGTAVISCLNKTYPDFEYLSLCPGIDEDGNTDRIVEARDIAAAINYAVGAGVSIMNISMGTTDFSERECIDEAVQNAYGQGIIIVASAPNENYPALPWGSPGVIKAREKSGNGYKVTLEKDEFGIPNCTISCKLFRVTTKEGKSIFAHGNSYSAVWITSKLIDMKLKNPDASIPELVLGILEEGTKAQVDALINTRYDVVRPVKSLNNPDYAGKRLILYSWTKEMHSIVRGTDILGYKIVGAVDYFRKGNINKDIGLLSHTTEYGVTVSADIEDIKEPADVLVIGYLDQIEKYGEKFTPRYILEYNLAHTKMDVFSFVPVPGDLEKEYEEAGLTIHTPFVFDEKGCLDVLGNIGCFVPVKKPVLGVFGTSSKQGKFTLQLGLREALKRNDVSVYHMSTEHQAALLGADLTFADGYECDKIMKVPLEDKLQVLRGIMVYIDNTTKADMIMVGGQSWVVPYQINNQSFMRYAIFLEGVRPDRNILVINPFLDSEEYVKDTIAVIKGIYKCKTFATAFSDYTPYVKNGRVVYKKLTEEDKEAATNKWQNILRLPCGCISDRDYMDRLAEETLQQFA